MEKEQIIKALECISRTGDVLCDGCDYRKYDGLACHRIGAENALALINSQEQRIKELTEKVETYRQELGKVRVALNNANVDNKRLTEENERLNKANEVYTELEQGCLVTGVKKVQANTVREIFKEIYSSLDYIEEQMEPEEIPECFFSVREDIEALKEKFESEGKEK